MKYLLIFLIISACGKYQEPIQQDLRDSDGDSIRNNIDSDKFKANIVTLDEIHATFEFQTGHNILKTHSYELTNKPDLESHSKDLLVKNPLSLIDKKFFSEFSRMSIKTSPKENVELVPRNRITINFSKTKNPPNSIYLVNSDRKIKISDWAENVELYLSQNDLNSIITGKSFLWLSHSYLNSNIEEGIKNKSYRVHYNKGSQSEVFYISKELTVSQVLNKLGVFKHKNIEEENLLTTTIKPEVSEWWVRILNKNDIVVVHANTRQLSDHYFTTLEHKTGTVSRFNGFSYANFSLSKNINARTLLKIRATQKTAQFSESYKDNRVRIGGRDNSEKYGCVAHMRSLTSEYTTSFSPEDLKQVLMINENNPEQQNDSIEVRYLQDELGPFWEIELMNTNYFELSLSNISKALYTPTGQYKSDQCIGNDRNQNYTNNLQTPERSLILNIEAFVEIIPE
jgi:hypothetical protein